MSVRCACLVRGLVAESCPCGARDVPVQPALIASHHPEIFAWWRGLEPADKEELLRYFDPRAEDISFTSQTDGFDWEPLPITSIGAFTDKENIQDGKLSYQQRFDYLDEHPEATPGSSFLEIDKRKITWRHINWLRDPIFY
jgi:hypothetical protein